MKHKLIAALDRLHASLKAAEEEFNSVYRTLPRDLQIRINDEPHLTDLENDLAHLRAGAMILSNQLHDEMQVEDAA